LVVALVEQRAVLLVGLLAALAVLLLALLLLLVVSWAHLALRSRLESLVERASLGVSSALVSAPLLAARQSFRAVVQVR
jgi:hypothetical protein